MRHTGDARSRGTKLGATTATRDPSVTPRACRVRPSAAASRRWVVARVGREVDAMWIAGPSVGATTHPARGRRLG